MALKVNNIILKLFGMLLVISVGLLAVVQYDEIYFLRIQGVQQRSGLFAVSESDTPISHVTGFYNSQGG